MDRIIEIQISNFLAAQNLAQRAVYIGLTVAALVYYISISNVIPEPPPLPLINLRFDTLESLQAGLLALYIGAGLVSSFSSARALSILIEIKDQEISSALARHPSILSTNLLYSSILAGALLGSGMLLASAVFNYGGVRDFVIYLLVSAPFLLSLRIGRAIYRFKGKDAEEDDPASAC